MLKKSLGLLAALCLAGQALAAGAGDSQFNPVLPDRITTQWLSTSGQITGRIDRFEFDNPTSGLWFDPPTVDFFVISLDEGAFTSVTAPIGFTGLMVYSDAGLLDNDFNGGETLVFSATPMWFTIRNIQPLLDPAASDFGSAFPLQLSFVGSVSGMVSGTVSGMVWTTVSAVPESDVYAMLALGLFVVGLVGSRRGRALGFTRD